MSMSTEALTPATLRHASALWLPRLRSLWNHRTVRVACVVALAHSALLWAAIHAVLRPDTLRTTEFIMASVVLESAGHATAPQQQAKPPTAPKKAPLAQRSVGSLAPAKPAPAPRLQAHSAATTITTANAEALPSAVPAMAAPATGTASNAPSSATSTQGGMPQGGSAAAATASNAPAQPAVVLPSADADYLNNPAPAYPRLSRRMGEEGAVIVRVLIGLQGTAEKAEIRTSSGFERLDLAALETVQRWRYVPGKRNGTPAAMWFNVPVRFVLE